MKKLGFIVLLFLCILLCLFPIRTRADSKYVYQVCSGTASRVTSPYQNILKPLMSYLSSNATTSATGFHNSSARINEAAVYGIFRCRGLCDVSPDVCSDCVSYATQYALGDCPDSLRVAMWFDECMIRYSNEDFLGKLELGGGQTVSVSSSVTDDLEERYANVFRKTMNKTATQAAAGDRFGRKFSVGEGYFSAIDVVYALAQCTPDFDTSDCAYCLSQCISSIISCCALPRTARAVFPSCNIRVDKFQFYNIASKAPSPSSPPRGLNPPTPTPTKGKERKSLKVLVAVVVAIGAVFLLIILGFCFLNRRRPILKKNDSTGSINDRRNNITSEHSLQYDFGTIQAATNNFSQENKIGEGGFGSVYKGVLSNGQDIAVKRLSQSSGQGALEFKNEVVVVAKLQHRNLVRLHGFCLVGEEKILIYEFLPNKSLDCIIFDPHESVKLDWSRRYKIISGIARGMLYLHEDSRLRIIHRDLKASNVLLDADMNAKVSDFGLAKIFGGDQTQGSTSRVVGTYGYMSPEYAIHGHFSVKSDVFSFGVLLLEIVSGKSNGSFYLSDRRDDLLSYAWKLWMEGNNLDLVDHVLEGSYSGSEVTRCIHIGLLCVQEDADARPSMATVVLMLNSRNSANLSAPQEPPFFPRFRSSLGIPNMTTDSIQSTYQSTPASLN